MNLIQVLSNPIKLQIMQFLQERESATTKQISEKLKDVPVPTLYPGFSTSHDEVGI